MWRRRRKKIDYSSKKYLNPFFRRKKAKFYNLSPSFNWRIRLIFLLILAIILGAIWFFFFAFYFNIKAIEVMGGKRIQAPALEGLVWEQTEERRFLAGSQKNINLFDKNELRERIQDKYSLENIAVDKKWPGKIIISIKERNPSLIWFEAEKYYYIDNKGNVISETDPIQINQKDYPLIENRGGTKIFGKKVEAKSDDLFYAIKLFNEFKNNYKKFEIDRFIIDNDLNTIKLSVINGPQIYFNTTADINEQISELIIFIDRKLKDNFKNKDHIDLRFGDRVYYE
jgi:cell division septal protein FtsQ